MILELVGAVVGQPPASGLDVAAGTGRFTVLLAELCKQVIAVEPVEEMAREVRTAVPSSAVVRGIAEALPIARNSVSLIGCAQAFHLFRANDALDEFSRVLEPDGLLALVSNTKDLQHPVHKALEDSVSPYRSWAKHGGRSVVPV